LRADFSILGGPDLIWMLLCMVPATLQYFLIGYGIDCGSGADSRSALMRIDPKIFSSVL
jgi:hypothetical protein